MDNCMQTSSAKEDSKKTQKMYEKRINILIPIFESA